jgi:hypothetical protein
MQQTGNDRSRATDRERLPDAATRPRTTAARVERSQPPIRAPPESRPSISNAAASNQRLVQRTISGGVNEVDVRTLLIENQTLRADNEQLRSLIVERSMASEQFQPEHVYASKFRELFADIETWVVKMDRSAGIQELPDSRADQILKALRETGTRGVSSAEFLSTNSALFRQAFRSPRSRVQLERHIIAALLFDKLLAPMVFGISTDWAQFLRRLVDAMERDGMRKKWLH